MIKKNFIICIYFVFGMMTCYAQLANYQLKFRYRISSKKLAELNQKGIHIVDDKGVPYQFCPKQKKSWRFECLLNNQQEEIHIETESITDSRINTTLKKTVIDPCYGEKGIINATTPNTLKFIQFKDTVLNMIGYPRRSLILHYQSIIVGINTLGLKIRPSVYDAMTENVYPINAKSELINLGFSCGYSFGWTKFTRISRNSWSITPGVSLGFTSEKMNDQPLKRKVITTNAHNFILSPALSVIVARNDIGLIFAYGTDVMFGENADVWAYQGKGYFGLGIAAGLKL